MRKAAVASDSIAEVQQHREKGCVGYMLQSCGKSGELVLILSFGLVSL